MKTVTDLLDEYTFLTKRLKYETLVRAGSGRRLRVLGGTHDFVADRRGGTR